MDNKIPELDALYDTAFEAGYGKGFNDGYNDGVQDFSIVMEDVIYNRALEDIRTQLASMNLDNAQEIISTLDSLQKITHLDSGSYITD